MKILFETEFGCLLAICERWFHGRWELMEGGNVRVFVAQLLLVSTNVFNSFHSVSANA